MAVTKHNLGNLNYFVRGATESGSDTYNITDNDFGVTLEFFCINSIPLTITSPLGISIDGVDNATISLNQGEYLKLQSRTSTTWFTVMRYKHPVPTPPTSGTHTLKVVSGVLSWVSDTP